MTALVVALAAAAGHLTTATMTSMGCRGMFFALTDEQEAALIATRDDAEVREFVEELEMGDWDGEPLDCETDKAWDAMHRCLSDGTLGCGRRLSPLDMAVLGGGHHYEGEEYVVAHLRPAEVVEVAAALEASTRRGCATATTVSTRPITRAS